MRPLAMGNTSRAATAIVVLVVAVATLMTACTEAQRQRLAAYRQQRQAPASSSYSNYEASMAAKNRSENEAFIAAAEKGRVPKDYKKAVDSAFEELLKDPASRKVEYSRNTQALVCGTVNAKNSYGGYTGKKPFTAWFDADGKLSGLLIWDAKDFSAWGQATTTGETGHKYYWLMKGCGFL